MKRTRKRGNTMTTETKRDKFVRLFKPRAERLRQSFKVLQNLGSSAYDPDLNLVNAMLTNTAADMNATSMALRGRPYAFTTPKPFKPMQMNESKARWALDMLQRGDTAQGIEMLRQALAATQFTEGEA